jgi:hypothetical protein
VEASSSVTIGGLQNEIGSRLAVPEGAFLNAGDLLRASCAARRSGTASSFTPIGRGGLPPDPAGPLFGSYRELGGATAAGRAGPVLAGNFGEGCKAAPSGQQAQPAAHPGCNHPDPRSALSCHNPP